MITMSENIIHTKEKARSHIVEAMTLIHFVEGVKKGDYPEQQKIYYAEINKAKNLLKKVYSPNNVIFNELNIHSNTGLNAALGTLNVGDEPFIDMKESNSDTFHAETYNGQIKNLVLEYAEAVHPNDEAQQDYLMDMIVSGEYQISIIEMQRKIENPTANQSRGREKVLASEGFDAETFNADSKEEARLKKYEKTYGEEGAKVRNRIFKRILAKADWGTKAGQWSARKSQALTDEYEEDMKGKGKKAYKTSKRTKTQKSLKKWGDQKWNTKSGQDSSKTGERYLPEKAIKALTDKEYKKTSAKKRQDSKKGKQFSDQPKDIAKKVAKYRSETFEADYNEEKIEMGRAIMDDFCRTFNIDYERDKYGIRFYLTDKWHYHPHKPNISDPQGWHFERLEYEDERFVIYTDLAGVPLYKQEWMNTDTEDRNIRYKQWKQRIQKDYPMFDSMRIKPYYKYDDDSPRRIEIHLRFNPLSKNAETFEAQSKPHSVDVSRSTNKEKKLMAIFEDKEGKKIKTTHFGARGMSDYTKHGDKDRMKLYESRHKKNEHWNRPMTAGSLSKNILWNTPSLAGSFNDYKRRFGLKGDLKVSRSAESYGAEKQLKLPLSFSTYNVNTALCIAANPYFGSGLCYDESNHKVDRTGNTRGSHGEYGYGEPTCIHCKRVWKKMSNEDKEAWKQAFIDWHDKYDKEISFEAESYGADWSIDTTWGEPDMEQNNDDWGIDWDSNDIGYTPEMLKAKRMKNRYIPPNFNVQRKDGRKYLFLDFDNTVRHTIPDPKPDEPKRRRPPHKAEEVYMIGGVAEKVREWANAGYFIIGLTNQSNIESGYNTTQDVVDAIKRTLDLLGMQFPVYFASHKNKSLPDYNFRKPMTGMIDAAISDFGSADRTYSVMVGDDWEYADSGMARNAGVHFIGVLPFLNMTVKEAKNAMFMGKQDGEIISLLNPDDLIPTFAKEYDNLMGGTIQSAESSYSKSPTLKSSDNMAMKMSMGTIVGVIGGLLLGYNAPALWSKYMSKDESAAESSIDGEQALANQGFIEDWSGGNEGDDNLSSQGNEASPAGLSYHYDPLATPDAMAHDPATRPPSFM